MNYVLTIFLRPGIGQDCTVPTGRKGSTGQILSWNSPSRTRLNRNFSLAPVSPPSSLLDPESHNSSPQLEWRVRVLPGRGTPILTRDRTGPLGEGPPKKDLGRAGLPLEDRPGRSGAPLGEVRVGRGGARPGRRGCVRRACAPGEGRARKSTLAQCL